MNKLYIALIPFFTIMSLYCYAQKVDTIEYGRFMSNTYTNNQFDLSVVVPDEYYFIEQFCLSKMFKIL